MAQWHKTLYKTTEPIDPKTQKGNQYSKSGYLRWW